MENLSVYQDISKRTGGDIYIGVAGLAHFLIGGINGGF